MYVNDGPPILGGRELVEWGTPDASYPLITPAASPNVTVTEMFQGKSTIAFHKARWEDMRPNL